jgi:glutathione S-transferase
MIKIYGSIVSPFVRKVLMVLEFKGMPYEIQSMNPYHPEQREELLKIHPLGTIPVYVNENIVIPDSSVICSYLEKKFPENKLYPNDPESYAKSLWYEEYADTQLINVSRVIFRNDERVAPILQTQPDALAYKNALTSNLPKIFDYLDKELAGKNNYLVDSELTIADISIFSAFLNLEFVGYKIDKQRWANLAKYVAHISEEQSIASITSRAMDVFKVRFK